MAVEDHSMLCRLRGCPVHGWQCECAPWVGTLTLPGETLREDLDGVLGQPSESHPRNPSRRYGSILCKIMGRGPLHL